MARVALSQAAINSQDPDNGIDLTAATYDTLVAGVDNGVQVPHGTGYIALNNDTGGAGVFTVVTPQPASYANAGLTIPDKTYNVGAGQILQIPFEGVLKQADGKYYIDCDIAGKVCVVQ